MKKKCVIISAQGRGTFTLLQQQQLEKAYETTFIANLEQMTAAAFIELTKNAEILAITRRAIRDLDQAILSKLRQLEALVIYATGYEWIDLDFCNERGITVKHLEDYSAETVAEHTLAMLLSVSRRIHLSHDKSRNMVPHDISLRGFELKQKVFGIWGFGTIGKRFAELIRPFSDEVFYYDLKKDDAPGGRARFRDRETLLSASDIIVLLASKTRGEGPLVGHAEIEKMKQGVVIINSSRASLVDDQAIIRGINEKKIYGYAVDDRLEIFNSPEIEYGRVLQTYHTGWYADEAIIRGTGQWVANILSLQETREHDATEKED